MTISYDASYIHRPTGLVAGQEMVNEMADVENQLDTLVRQHEAAGTDPEEDLHFRMVIARARILNREAQRALGEG